MMRIAILDILDELTGIWKYAAAGLWSNNGGRKDPNEYILILIKLWDRLDALDIPTIEGCLVELDGLIMKEGDPTDKILRTQLLDYIKARQEQGGMKPTTYEELTECNKLLEVLYSDAYQDAEVYQVLVQHCDKLIARIQIELRRGTSSHTQSTNQVRA